MDAADAWAATSAMDAVDATDATGASREGGGDCSFTPTHFGRVCVGRRGQGGGVYLWLVRKLATFGGNANAAPTPR